MTDIAYTAVQRDYERGLRVESWIENFLRNNFSNEKIVVKLTDRAVRAHKYDEIKDIPSDPDINLFLPNHRINTFPAKIWVTHKVVKNYNWSLVRDNWINNMYWKLKTILTMKENEWLMYAIYQDDYTPDYEPLELLLCYVGNLKEKRLGEYWAGWSPLRGGKVRGINMKDAVTFFSNGKCKYQRISDAFDDAMASSKKCSFNLD